MGPFTTSRLYLRRFQLDDLETLWTQLYQDVNERSMALHRRLGYRILPNPDKNDPMGFIAILDNPGL